MNPTVKFKRTVSDTTCYVKFTPQPVPEHQTDGAACVDVRAAHGVTIDVSRTKIVSTGFDVEVPEGYELQVRSRSGLAAKNGVFVLNAPGIVDEDYRGELKVILTNLGDAPFHVEPGDRIAQLALVPVVRATFELVDELSPSGRGRGGFGSTGVR